MPDALTIVSHPDAPAAGPASPLAERMPRSALWKLCSEYTDIMDSPPGIPWSVLYLAKRHPIFSMGKLWFLQLCNDDPSHWTLLQTIAANKRGREHLEETKRCFPEFALQLAEDRAAAEREIQARARRAEEEQARSMKPWIDAIRPEVRAAWERGDTRTLYERGGTHA